MLIYPPGASEPLRGDLVVRSTIRSDLVPIPQTVEIEVRDLPECDGVEVGAVCKIGHHGFKFKLVSRAGTPMPGTIQNARHTGTKSFIGVYDPCERLIAPMQRASVTYSTSIGDAYAACGSRASIGDDIPIPLFVCLKGHTPTFEIAKALQESAAAPVLSPEGVLSFKRIGAMTAGEPVRTVRLDSAEVRQSAVSEQHIVPFAFSTDATGAVIQGRAESGRGVAYRASATQDIINNLSSYIVTRRKLTSIFAPDLMAGDVVSVGGVKLIVVTAAHVMQVGGAGVAAEQYTTLWLGEAVTK